MTRAKSKQAEGNSGKTNSQRKFKTIKRDVAKEPLVDPEFVTSLRNKLGITQNELAQLLGVTNITILSWEKQGLDSIRGSTFFMYKTLVSLLRQGANHEDFVDPKVTAKYLQLCSRKDLFSYYTNYPEHIDPEILSIINSGTILGVMMAIIVDLYLDKIGVGSPAKDILENRTPVASQQDSTDFLENLDI